MSKISFAGVYPRSGSRALLAASLALALPHPAATAEPAGVKFSGVLDYSTFQAAARSGKAVTIKYSPGGTGAAALALARVSNVVVDGRCNSACAWSFVRNANACFTSRASFGFHAAHDPGTGRRLNAATGYWLKSVRPSLRGKLEPLLSTSGLIRVSALEMRRHYGDRACGAQPKTQIAALAKTQPGQKTAQRFQVALAEGFQGGREPVLWPISRTFNLHGWGRVIRHESGAAVAFLDRLRQADGENAMASAASGVGDVSSNWVQRDARWTTDAFARARTFASAEDTGPAAEPKTALYVQPRGEQLSLAETSLAVAMTTIAEATQMASPDEGAAATFFASVVQRG